MRPIYKELASRIDAVQNCIKHNNSEWQAKHTEAIDEIMRNTSPSGSGIDNGTTLNWERSSGDKLVFETAFHHMDENGYYDGWTEHTITVRPSLLSDIDLTICGRNRNEINDYLHEVYYCWLAQTSRSFLPSGEVTE